MFHQRHAKLYGHQLQQRVELVTLRTKVQSAPPMLELPTMVRNDKKAVDVQTNQSVDNDESLPVYRRDELMATIKGPALITETVSTTYLAPGWECRPDEHGSLLLTKMSEGQKYY